MLTSISGGKHTGVYRRMAGAIAFCLLLLAALGGAVPLAGQVTPPSAAVPGDWTWMSGSDTIPVVQGAGQGVSGVYGAVGAFGSMYFPGGRWGAPGWIDSNNHLWLFGGFGYAGNSISGKGVFGDLNDLWQFDPSNNEWAYMGGGTTLANNYCAESPTYGTQGVFAAGNVPGGRQSAASWIDKSGNLWLFGGDGVGAGTLNACGTYSVGYLNDLWEFNLSTASTSTPEWAWIGGSSTPNAPGVYILGTLVPGAREYASTWTDKSGNFWLFGGFGYDNAGNFGYLNDLWEFSPTLNQWTWIDGSSTVPTYSGQPGNYGPLGSFGGTYFPGGRYGASTWTDSSGNFWLFGGLGIDANGNGGNLDDLWEFNPTPGGATTNYWAWMNGGNTAGPPAVYGTMGTPATTNTPGGRYEASSWVDNSGNFWIFGGQGTGELNDLWAFNPPTSKWVWMGGSNTGNQPGSYSASPQMPLATNIPGGRNQTTSWTDTYGNFWLFGGDGHVASTSVVGALNDLWVYPPPAICWGPPSAIQISPATIPYGFEGKSYFENFTATGGCEAGYMWSVTSGTALSAVGLSLTSAGDISGYPNATETAAPFTVKVTDPQGNIGTQDYTLTIYAGISATPPTLPAGTVGVPYSQPLTASGGSGGPFNFSVASGTALSAVGLSLSSAGLISGTPNATETAAPFAVQIADSLGDFTHQNYTLTINAAAPLTISPTTLPAGTAGTPYYQPLTATGGSGTGYSWTITSGATSLGAIGLTQAETGAIVGIPIAGQANFTVQVTDSLGATATQSYTLTINPIGGQPAMVTDNETITLADSVPDTSDSETITVTDKVNVGTPLNITTAASAPTGIVGVPYTPTLLFTASGGVTPYIWSITGQPSGLVINSSTGVISGTPTADGDFLVTVTVTDSLNNSVFAQSPLTVTPPAPIANLSPGSLAFSAQASGTASAAQTVTLSNTGSAALSINGTGIGILGPNATDFSQTNPCGTSVAAGGNCVISVKFTPSLSAGSETATLNVADNASGSPQQVQLSGIALPPPGVSCNIPTVPLSGDSATVQITCTATDFTGTIALECNLPASLSQYITCSFSPSSLVFSSSVTQASTTLTIQSAQSASLERRSRSWAVTSGGVALGAVLWLPTWAFVMRQKRGRSNRGVLFLLILFCGLPLITSCGGKSKGPPTPPSGTYQASVVLTGPGLNETITFMIQEP